ncbi:hypothetical protein [Halobellus clavatus]|uniref:hypothetical protein n=1 Tax=Halobellus clavatus TaxID=660517 RepID=UPI000B7C5F0A|nr:hypothetical protein [Halobellus clavatus]
MIASTRHVLEYPHRRIDLLTEVAGERDEVFSGTCELKIRRERAGGRGPDNFDLVGVVVDELGKSLGQIVLDEDARVVTSLPRVTVDADNFPAEPVMAVRLEASAGAPGAGEEIECEWAIPEIFERLVANSAI